MVNLIFAPDNDTLTTKGIVKTLYDLAAGTGGMLSVSEEYLRELNPDAKLEVFAQDYNPQSYAICGSDMMIKGGALTISDLVIALRRNESTTRNRIDKELKTMKAEKFIEYDLESLVINKDGKEVNSFRIIPKETAATKEAIKQAKRTDGLWVIVTNNTGKEEKGKKLTEEDLISAYRDKNQIEQAFKDVKSFIRIQSFNV